MLFDRPQGKQSQRDCPSSVSGASQTQSCHPSSQCERTSLCFEVHQTRLEYKYHAIF